MNTKITLPIISISEISNLRKVVPLEKEHADGNISAAELEIICQLIDYHKPLNIFEIGTFDGRTTVNLAHFSSPTSKVFTIDLPKEAMLTTKYPLYAGDEVVGPDSLYVNKEETGTRYKNKKEREKIIQLYGDTATFDFSPYINQMDFVFIDGSHAKDYVRNDTEVAMKLLKDGSGVLLWHDYGVWKDVTVVLDSYFLNDIRFKNCRNIEGTSFVYLNLK
ncbi:MAG: class I SAM-dependent methyltransferase [Candidatus Gottesmanbacteria bacterium]|nr:class I SAM-dependent methyltransferase [Candidatus Gottesmanbacteria bacterium]